MATGLLAAPLATAAQAQTVNPTPNVAPSESLTQPPPKPNPADVVPSVEHLFGDWGGLRTELDRHGISVQIDNTNEFASNVSGGTQRSTTNAGQTAVQADIDWQKLAGIPNFATHFAAVGRYGGNLSNAFGDQLSPAQEIYGAGGSVVAHLVYLYGELALQGGRIDISLGRIPVGNDFATSLLYCNFMNNAFCGNPKALSGQVGGFSTWPDGTWGSRIRVRPTEDTYLQVGIYQVSQYLYGTQAGWRSAWLLSGSGSSGVEVPVEVAWKPAFTAAKLPGNYKLGLGFDSSTYTVFQPDTGMGQGGNGLGAAIGSSSRTQQGRLQFWALADQMILRSGPGDQNGLILLAGYAHDDPASFVRSNEVFGGFSYQGFWKARPTDTLNAAFSYQKISSQLTDQQQLDQELDLPFANAASGVQTRELIFELNYQIHVYRGVTFTPDFQYINRPNAQANIHDAVVLGFKSHVEF